MQSPKIKVHNLNAGTRVYADVDDLITSVCEWYDENNGYCDLSVGQDDRLIFLMFIHDRCSEDDTTAVIIKDELADYINVDDLINQLKACC